MSSSHDAPIIFFPEELGKKDFNSTQSPHPVRFTRRELFVEKIRLGYTIDEANDVVGYSPSELQEIVQLPEIVNIIREQKRMSLPFKEEIIFAFGEMFKSCFQDICTVDRKGNVILRNPDDLSIFAYSMVKKLKVKNGIVQYIEMRDTSRLMNQIAKIYKLYEDEKLQNEPNTPLSALLELVEKNKENKDSPNKPIK